jgi:tripartite-type tricarboxylate transporter receptor subunit TctC
MNITRRAFALGISSLMGTQYLHAQPRASHLTLLVAQPAGGITDVFARAVAPALSQRLGRAAVVENIPGASGSIAAHRLLAGARDGSTLFVGSPSETVLAPLTLRSARYKPADFRLLGLLNDSPLALYARSDLPANDLDELVALSQQRGNRPLSYGSTGQGSLFHLVTELLRSTTGLQATHVPYRGGMPLLTDLQGGVIDFTTLPVDALLGGMVAGGRMKVLGVSSARRLARFPAAPSFDESSAAPALGRPSIWVGLLIPATTSEDVSRRLHRTVVEVLGDPDVRKAVDVAGGSVPPPMSLAEAARFYAADAVKLQALAAAVRIEPL